MFTDTIIYENHSFYVEEFDLGPRSKGWYGVYEQGETPPLHYATFRNKKASDSKADAIAECDRLAEAQVRYAVKIERQLLHYAQFEDQAYRLLEDVRYWNAPGNSHGSRAYVEKIYGRTIYDSNSGEPIWVPLSIYNLHPLSAIA